MGKIEINGKTFVLDKKTGEYVRWITIKGRAIPIVMSREESAQWAGQQADKIRGKPGEGESQNFATQGGSMDGASIPGDVPTSGDIFAPYPKGFKYIDNPDELIKYAKDELGIDASELYRVVDINVANAINEELLRAREMFGDLPIKKLGTYKGDIKINEDGSKEIIWGRYVPETQKMLIRFVDPEDGELMTYQKWQNLAMTMHAQKKCSTHDWRQVFRHEIGHGVVSAFLYKLGKETWGRRMSAIIPALFKLDIKPDKALSEQATTPGEIVAESVAVIMNGEKTHRCANIVLRILMKG